MNFALPRKLVLLVCIPLGGAAIFAGLGMVRLAREDLDLRRIQADVRLTTLLAHLRETALNEQRDTWDLYRDAIARAGYRAHLDGTNNAATALQRGIAGAHLEGRYGPDGALAITSVTASYRQLADARDFFAGAKPDSDPDDSAARAMRARYANLSAQILAAMNLLNHAVTVPPARARLDGLVWFGRVSQAAEDERIQMEHGFDQPVPTVASLIRIQHATSQRLYSESNLVLMAPPELADYWKALLADPVYARVSPLTTEIFKVSSLKAEPFNADRHAEWTKVTHHRNELLDAVEPHVLADLGALLTDRRQGVERKLVRSGAIFLGFLLLSAAIAAAFIRRTTRLLKAAFRQLDEGIDTISSAVTGLRSGADRLAEGAAREAAGLERTHASLATLTSGTEVIVATAQTTVEHMNQTIALVASSREAMQAVTQTMAEISESSNATFRIVKTIDEISFQTNLLAFNASIEAATAGAAGAGFTVVAEEVRELAKRASQATAETGRLVEDARTAIATGAALDAEVAAALRDVDANAVRAGELMHRIHTASSQMLQSMQQLGDGARSMDSVTQQNAAIADHNASTAGAISDESDRLHATIRGLEDQLLGAHVMS